MTKTSIFTWTISAAILALLAVDVTLLTWFHYSASRSRQDLRLFIRQAPEKELPGPIGFTLRGDRRPLMETDDLWAIRYVSKNCEYCAQDEALWKPLSVDLQKRHCRLVNVAPGLDTTPLVGDSASRDEQPLVFLHVGWIRQYHLYSTPTLLIVSRTRGLIWAHQGVLKDKDPTSAIAAVEGVQVGGSDESNR